MNVRYEITESLNAHASQSVQTQQSTHNFQKFLLLNRMTMVTSETKEPSAFQPNKDDSCVYHPLISRSTCLDCKVALMGSLNKLFSISVIFVNKCWGQTPETSVNTNTSILVLQARMEQQGCVGIRHQEQT